MNVKKAQTTPSFEGFKGRKSRQAVSGPSTPAPSASHSENTVSTGNVLKMQQAIINFANSTKDSAKESTAFKDFMVQNYTLKEDDDIDPNAAKEYDPKREVSKVKDKKETQQNTDKMSIVFDTLRRIGGEKSEFVVDGNWGPKTNNALKNVIKLMAAVFDIMTAMGIQAHYYDASGFEKFKQIPYTDDDSLKSASPSDKETRAAAAVSHLKQMALFYPYFKKSVIEKPAYSNYVSGNQAYFNASPVKKEVGFTPQEQEAADDLRDKKENSAFNQTATLRFQNQNFKISLSDLVSQEAFAIWCERNKIDRQQSAAVLKALKTQTPFAYASRI